MIVFDCETYPDLFCLCALDTVTRERRVFEISTRRVDLVALLRQMTAWRASSEEMVGFNNLMFDYPLLHFILTGQISSPMEIFERAQAQINVPDNQKFAFMVRPYDQWVRQIDLFKIHHFDNKARMTSLKALEFNMRMTNISDLPYPVGSRLLPHEMNDVIAYCWNDVEATDLFLAESMEKIEFRRSMSEKYDYDFINCSDVKVGKQVFQIELEQAGVRCYDYDPESGRSPRQTPRNHISLCECIPSYIHFENAEFAKVQKWLAAMVITETKDAFDLKATVGGLEFKFGTGGIHASVENKHYVANKDWMIYDVDVTSLYPSIAIENGYYPKHLGPEFVETYRRLRERRLQYKKGTPENAALKLALNGVYGDSNSPFSVFYDPKFTMSITITGQMVIAMLVERLVTVPGLEIIQANTDGITLWMPRAMKGTVDLLCSFWEYATRLSLEHKEYAKMFIADVNSYIAVDTSGEAKRKGRYEWDIDWHQNASALVVRKVAEKVLLEDAPIEATVKNWPDLFDFMLRVKVPRSSKLVLETEKGDEELENTQRYYISTSGYPMTKIMPPLPKDPTKWRRIGINSGYLVTPCNDILNADSEIDFRWYINEVEKLVMGVM